MEPVAPASFLFTMKVMKKLCCRPRQVLVSERIEIFGTRRKKKNCIPLKLFCRHKTWLEIKIRCIGVHNVSVIFIKQDLYPDIGLFFISKL